MDPRTRKPAMAAVVLVGAAVVLQLASSLSPAVADAYARWAGPLISRVLTGVSRWVPVSLTDFVEGGAIVALLWWIVVAVRRVRAAEKPKLPVLWTIVAEAWVIVGALHLSFLLLFGIGYGRPGLAERMGWDIADDSREGLIASGEELVGHVNGLYLAIHGSEDGGEPTGTGVDPRTFDAALRASWPTAGAAMGMAPGELFDRGPTKPLLSSPIYSKLLIAGIYFPYTGEANINMQGPVWQQPLTRAHEMAHQRFFYDESDANFAGFLACVAADDPLVRYGGWLFAQRQVLKQLQRQDPELALELVRRRHPGVQRDVTFAVTFWRSHVGKASGVSQKVNDAYLKANGISDGVQAYGRSVRLLQYWLADCGGVAECDPLREPTPSSP
ncbi:MAG: DUF3810 domain-containing protein [Proteobacteria bacterium]|nr:DUF3810 domain-containing protein [Pseudomonadota bacterium]